MLDVETLTLYYVDGGFFLNKNIMQCNHKYVAMKS